MTLQSTEDDLAIGPGQALSTSLVRAVHEVCDRAEDAGGTAAVVIRLDGDGSAGRPADLSVHLVSQWERALRRLERLPAPLVATVCGTCTGPALEALLTADYRIAAIDARLAVRHESGEVWPGMLLHRLANQVGVARARRLVLGGAELTAAEAQAWGVVDTMAEPAAVAATADRAAGLLGRTPGKDLAVLRRLVLDAPAASHEEALGAHLAACDRLLRRSGRSDRDGG